MHNKNLTIRSERIGDEEAISTVIFKAFENPIVSQLVDVLRRDYHAFDRKYSIVACIGDEIVGYTLFIPCRLKLRGKFIQAMHVAPVTVAPEYQKMGIGQEMLNYGHKLGSADGFDLCFLFGHPEYYPRVGYKPCLGVSKGIVEAEKLPEPEIDLIPYPLTKADLPWLVTLFEREFEHIDFSWHWAPNLSEWRGDGYDAIIWRTKEGRRIGYSVARGEMKKFKLVLAEDGFFLRQLIYKLKPEVLGHHRAGWLGQQLKDEDWLRFETMFHKAGMAFDLGSGVLDEYLAQVDFEKDEPGFSAWPLAIVES